MPQNPQENPNTLGAEDTVPQPTAPVEQPAPVVADIAKELSQQAVAQAEVKEDVPVEAPSKQIDLSQFSPEMLQALKQALAVTPDRAQTKAKKPTIELRVMYMDINREIPKYVVDFKQARMGLKYNSALQKDEETLKILVLFAGDTEYTEVVYSEFMQSDRVKLEVVSQREEKEVYSQGDTYKTLPDGVSKVLVSMDVTTVQYFYTVKLPNGTTIELQDKVVNA